MLAWANGCMKSLKNEHFAFHFNLVSGSNKQPSKSIESWMNLPYLNKNISKCTIYIKTIRFKGSLKENYYNRKISANILIPKIT